MTAAGLAVAVRRGWQARPAVAQALAETLGSEPAAPVARRPDPRRVVRMLLWPFPTRPRRVVRVANLAYGDAGRHNRLDLYHRRDRPEGAPILVYLHGGGYYSGRKHWEARPLLHHLAGEGWLCVSANYRLKPAGTFPAHLVDAKRVIAWVCAHGATYGADPSERCS